MSDVKEEVNEEVSPPAVYEIDVSGSVNEEMGLQVARAVRANTERLPFLFYISSTGGDANVGLVMNDVIDTIMAPVTFVAQNFVGSMAVTLMQKPEYLRLCYKHTRFLCHDLKITIVGNMSEASNQLNNAGIVSDTMLDRYSECTGLEGDELRKKVFDRDRIYSAQQALDIGTRGLVDGIILRDFGLHKYLCRTRGGLKVIDITKHSGKDVEGLPVWEPKK